MFRILFAISIGIISFAVSAKENDTKPVAITIPADRYYNVASQINLVSLLSTDHNCDSIHHRLFAIIDPAIKDTIMIGVDVWFNIGDTTKNRYRCEVRISQLSLYKRLGVFTLFPDHTIYSYYRQPESTAFKNLCNDQLQHIDQWLQLFSPYDIEYLSTKTWAQQYNRYVDLLYFNYIIVP